MKVWHMPRNAVKGMILSGWVFAGTGCLLIRRRVFESGLRFRYLAGVGQDILFMYDAQKAGFRAKVHGDVECGHLPEWPLHDYAHKKDVLGNIKFLTLDVGCGHAPKGDVNVDLFPQASAHRCADQRFCDDIALKVHKIPNFLVADACHLPFRDDAFENVISNHVIEHVFDAELMLREIVRVSKQHIEIRCPHSGNPHSKDETKPLHFHNFHPSWFQVNLTSLSLLVNVRTEYSQGLPFEIVARAEKGSS